MKAVFVLVAGTLFAAAAEPPTADPPPSLDYLLERMSHEEVAQAIDHLRAKFLDPSAASEDNLRRAALRGLIDQWSPGLELEPIPAPEPARPYPFLAEILDNHIAYIRLGTLNASTLAQFDATLEGLGAKGADALILDLRGVEGGQDFEMAASFARRLVVKGKVLFSLQRPAARQERIFTSNQPPLFEGLLIVLMDGRTAGSAEALAATLKENAGAMLVGSDSAGAAVEYESLRINPHAMLRVAVARAHLPARGPLFPGRLKPDIAVATPPAILDQIFRESAEKGVSQFVFETERRRMNEASLVANTNPELDAATSPASQRGQELKDTALQRAVDLVTAIQFYKARSESR